MITVSPGHFAAQMAHLVSAGCTTIGSTQLSAYLAGEPLRKKCVLLTFDDGYLDNWVHAHSVLQAHELTALCFLVTSWIGEGRVRAHARSGATLPPLLNHRHCEMAIEKGEGDRAILVGDRCDARSRNLRISQSPTSKYGTGNRSVLRRSSQSARASDWHFGQCRLPQVMGRTPLAVLWEILSNGESETRFGAMPTERF